MELVRKVVFVILLITCTSVMLNAQQFKIGKNVNSLKPSAVLELEDPNQALLLTRVFNPSTAIATPYRGMIVFDSSVSKLSYYDGSKWLYPVASDTNIYKYDGTLVANRRVILNGKTLAFVNPATDSVYFTNGKVGININPQSALHVKGATRTDSLVLVSNSLYKKFSTTSDSIAVIDSIGRVMKVGINDILNSSNNNINWVIGPSNQWTANLPVGSQTSTYGVSGFNYSNDPDGYVQMANFMYVKDTVAVKCDVYPGDMGGNQQGYYLVLLEYSDALGTLVQMDTLMTFVGTIGGISNTLGAGLSSKTVWNNNLVYGQKLQASTRYIKVRFLSSGINSAWGRGFKNVSVSTPTVNVSDLNYVHGGNSFGTIGILGLMDNNHLSIMTNNVSRMMVMNSGNVGIGSTSPISKLQVSGAVRTDSLVLTSLNAGSATNDSLLTINPSTGVVRRVSPTTIKSSVDTSIYSYDGTLKGNRMVTMGVNSLTFSQGTGTVNFLSTASASDTGINLLGNISGVGNNFSGVIVNSTAQWQTTGLQIGNTNGSNTATYQFNLMGVGQSFGKLGLYNSKVGSYSMVIDTTGKIGIGTTSPSKKLDVNGTSIIRDTLFSKLILMNAVANEGDIKYLNGLYGYNDLNFSGNNGTNVHMYIGNGGNVGIGSTSPTQLLDIQKSGTDNYIRIQAGATGANSSGILFNEHNNDYGWRMRLDAGSDNFYLEAVSGSTIDRTPFFVNRTSGFVGIGTITPVQLLDVNGTIKSEKLYLNNLDAGSNTDKILVLGNDKFVRTIDPSSISTNIYNSNGTLEGDRNVNMGGYSLYFTNRGNIGLNTTTPGEKLDVNGNIKSSSTVFAVRVQGTSDARLKKDISPIQGALAKVLQLKGVTYTWRKDMEKESGYTFKAGADYGVIAQDIEKVLPELVQKDSKGFLTVDYAHITPVLIEAIKEQQKEIEDLQIKVQQVNQLQNEVNELKAMMQAMKNLIKK